MTWHSRYSQQAGWTRELRSYVFERVGLAGAKRLLEVGCGTGAILSDVKSPAGLYGLDIDGEALVQARLHAPAAYLTCGDALQLPYPAGCFDIVYCHLLLLWTPDPLTALIEMKRVTRDGGYLLALAEPDYTCRIDEPADLVTIGRMQTEALRRRGADVGLGGRLADLFARAGIQIVEAGVLQDRDAASIAPDEHDQEWAVLESDVAGLMPDDEIRRFKMLDEQARLRGERVLKVPSYFAWGKGSRGNTK